MPVQEIAKEDTRQAVETKVLLAPDVDDFLQAYSAQKGSVGHCINAIVRLYRDSLPAKLRGGQEAQLNAYRTSHFEGGTKSKAAAA